MNNYFDKIYCINLDRRTDRWQFVENQFHKFGISVHRFPAYDKEKLQKEVHRLEKQFPKQFEWYIRFAHDERFTDLRERKHHNRRHIGGGYACAKSHVGVIKEAYRLGLNNVFIFEDDIALSENFSSQIKMLLAQLPPDWDMFYLGGEQIRYLEQTTPDICKMSCYCAHAYAIKSTLFQHVVDVFDNNPMLAITGLTGGSLDSYYADIVHPAYKCYIAKSPIVFQNKRYNSDIV